MTPNRFVMVFVETRKTWNAKMATWVRESKRRTRVFVHGDKRMSPLQAANAACVKEGNVLVDVYPLSASR